jgi:hypothetical protein
MSAWFSALCWLNGCGCRGDTEQLPGARGGRSVGHKANVMQYRRGMAYRPVLCLLMNVRAWVKLMAPQCTLNGDAVVRMAQGTRLLASRYGQGGGHGEH